MAKLFDRVRQLFDLVPVLDLHGLGVKEAQQECRSFLQEAAAAGIDSVKIVYGKGNRSAGGVGVLRQVVPHWLDSDFAPLIDRYQRIVDGSGGDGAVRVWLRSPSAGG